MSGTALSPWQQAQAEMRGMLARRANDIKALGTVDSERLIVVAMHAYRKLNAARRQNDPDIDRGSLAECVMRAAQMGLEAGTDQAYLVPYKGIVSLIVGPRGLIDCAYRSDRVAQVSAQVVIEGDEFDCDFDKGVLLHKPGKARPIVQAARAEKITHAYARLDTIVLVGGKVPHVATRYLILTREDIEYYRQFSAARNSAHGPWVQHYQGMAMKTALKHIFKHAPTAARSPMLELALREDENGHWVPPEAEDNGEGEAPALEPSRTQSVKDQVRQQAEGARARRESSEAPPDAEPSGSVP